MWAPTTCHKFCPGGRRRRPLYTPNPRGVSYSRAAHTTATRPTSTFLAQAGGLFVAATTRKNISPSYVLELLHRVARVIKDYCGVMNEDALRKNSILTYELLDELLDYGYAQSTSTESLKVHVFNEPATPLEDGAGGKSAKFMKPRGYGVFSSAIAAATGTGGGGEPGIIKRDAVQRSVLATGREKGGSGGGARNEIFVDVVEKLNVTFNPSGHLLTSEVNGSIQIRNFLHGTPQIRLALPEDLAIGGRDLSPYGGDYSFSGAGAVLLDDCNFHESADLKDFDTDRTIILTPPEGEFSLMNYRSANDFNPPFKVTTLIDETSNFKVGVTLKIKADFPAKHTCTGLVVKFPVPKGCLSANASLEANLPPGTQHAAYNATERQVVWQFKKVKGGAEHTLSIKISLQDERIPNVRKECGPVSLGFTIPMYNVSRLMVRYLQIGEGSKSNAASSGGGGKGGGKGPHRWVRYVTKSSSYVCRV